MHTAASVARRQQTFGYTQEELKILLSPMARTGGEALGSMGTDTPIAVLSDRPRLIFDYFTQLFAQVTNPPLDAIREELVTSLGTVIGPEGNALAATPAHARQVVLPFPVIDNDELAKIVHVNADGDLPGYATHVVRGLYDVTGGARGDAGPARGDLRRGLAGHRRGRPVRRAVRPRLGSRLRADPVAAADLGRPPPPHPREDPHAGRPARGGRRRARGAPRRAAHRVWRRGGQPVPRDGVGRGPRPLRRHRGRGPREGRQEPHQGARQGRPEGHVQDGHLDGGVLPRCAGVRGDRPVPGAGRPLLHRHRLPAGWHRARRDRGRDRGPARRGIPAGRRAPPAPQARGGRRVPVAPRGRAAPLRPRHRVPAAALDAAAALRHLQAVHPARRRAVRAADDPARAVRAHRLGRAAAGADRGGRAGQRDRQALQHRRHVATARSARRPTRPWPSR